MKRQFRAAMLRWLMNCGMCVPGAMTHPEVSYLLLEPEPPSPAALPPRHGPERMAPPDLTIDEQELWDCLQGYHGDGCVRAG
jgi:hypothetical protein